MPQGGYIDDEVPRGKVKRRRFFPRGVWVGLVISVIRGQVLNLELLAGKRGNGKGKGAGAVK